MASAVLFLFSASIMMFQISCSKTANAGTSLINGTASKILFRDGGENFMNSVSVSGGAISQITIELPVGYTDYVSKKIWQTDGTNIFCTASKSFGGTTTPTKIIFKTDMNGGNSKFIATYKDIDELFIY